MEKKKRYIPLTRKVNVIIAVSLIVGIGGVIAFFSLVLVGQIESLTIRNLVQQTELLGESIQTVMLNGEAPFAVDLLERVRKKELGFNVQLYRVNGDDAFSDNTTITAVNSRQNFRRFPERTEESALIRQEAPDQEALTEALTPSPLPGVVSFEKQEENEYIFTIYRPLMNKARCWVCHGTDATFRGVIAIDSDITGSVESRRTFLVIGIVFFLILVGLLTVILTQYLHQTVIYPVRMIGMVCANVTNGIFKDRVDVKNHDEIGRLGETVNKMVVGLHERFELTKYVSSSTIQSIAQNKAGERAEVTILFSDIRGFTSYSESKRPEEVVESLNKILNFQTDLITQYGGDVDKYVGDEIVAFYADDDPEVNACLSALAIQRELALKGEEEYRGLTVGIGINSGEVIMGMVGSEKRADYTIIGDNVNVASRLCSAATTGQIIVAESVYRKVREKMTAQGPFKIKLKGKSGFLRVYILTGMRGTA